MMKNPRLFASDNCSGVHPAVLQALIEANDGHVIAYGNDSYTEKANRHFKEIFGTNTEVYFVFLGTGANVLGLKAMTQSHHSVICAETAHIHVDECGAPERFTGCKLLPVMPIHGKLTPELIKPHLHGFDFEHHSQPKVISITQPTEVGTLYRPEEIQILADLAHEYGLLLHMDGARLANAAVALDLPFRAFTRDVGVDVLSFGGTKNGLMFGEAIVFFNTKLADGFKYTRKQGMQLASKMRYISVQFNVYFEQEIWRKNAAKANHMAKYLAQRLGQYPDIKITHPVEVNGVFAEVPREIIAPLQEKCFFYVWNEETAEVRWMCSFDTTESDVDDFVKMVHEELKKVR